MALYTSYYTRQLALRPESLAPEHQNVEGEKTLQKSVARRTVDVTGPYFNWLQLRYIVRSPSEVPPLSATPVGALGLLPPTAYAAQPTSLFTVKFAGQAPSKTRSSVNVAVWTPDGRRCLTGTQAGEFCMWGGQTFQFETIIQAHETPVRAMTFTHGGNFLVSGDDGGHVRYWRTNLELVKSMPAHREAIRGVAFAPSDLKFATGSDDSTVRVWDFARVTAEHVLAGHGGDVKCVDWHPKSAVLVSGSKDGLVKLWCARSGRSLGTMHGHKGTITASAWHANGHWVLTGCRDQTCKVWDIRMQAELATFVGQGRDVTQVAWHPMHEEVFVSGGHDGSLCYWLAGRQTPQGEVRGAHEGTVWATAWHPSGHLLATGAADATTKFWCRARPGDPFMDQQEAEQAELAAALDGEAAAAAPVKAQAPTLFAPPSTAVGNAPSAIPGIGDAVASQPVAPLDIFSASAPADAGAPSAHHHRSSAAFSPGFDHPQGHSPPLPHDDRYSREESARGGTLDRRRLARDHYSRRGSPPPPLPPHHRGQPRRHRSRTPPSERWDIDERYPPRRQHHAAGPPQYREDVPPMGQRQGRYPPPRHEGYRDEPPSQGLRSRYERSNERGSRPRGQPRRGRY